MSRAKLTSRLGFDGILIEDVRFAGLRFDAVIEPDHAEVARRDRVGLGPVVDRDILEALFALPLANEIPIDDVDPIVAAFLSAVPRGIVEIRRSRIERLWKPAVSVVGVMVSHGSWQRGRQSPGCRRAEGSAPRRAAQGARACEAGGRRTGRRPRRERRRRAAGCGSPLAHQTRSPQPAPLALPGNGVRCVEGRPDYRLAQAVS